MHRFRQTENRHLRTGVQEVWMPASPIASHNRFAVSRLHHRSRSAVGTVARHVTGDVRTDRTSPERPLSETFQVLGKGSRRQELSTAGIKFRPTISRPTQAGSLRSNLHFRQAVRVASIRVRLRFNPLRSDSCPASRFDARKNTKARRLYGRGSPVNVRGSACIKVDLPPSRFFASHL